MSARADLDRCLRNIRQSFEITLHSRSMSLEQACQEMWMAWHTLNRLRTDPDSLNVSSLRRIAEWADESAADPIDSVHQERAVTAREYP